MMRRSPSRPRNRRVVRRILLVSLVFLVSMPGAWFAAAPPNADGEPEAGSGRLQPATSFESITDDTERARAIFTEAGKVIMHPRCVNCHPAGDRPHQGDGEAHEPVVGRGTDGFGAVGMRCATCHQEANYDPAGMPGAPHWHLAPRAMAWEGLSLGEICEQIKDRTRNGDRDLAAVVKHMKEDPLVLWGFAPGADREPVPGDPHTFGELVEAWAEAGAACP